MKLSKTSSSELIQLAEQEIARRNYAEARRILETDVQNQGTTFANANLLGQIAVQEGDMNTAANQFRKAAEFGEAPTTVFRNLGMAEVASGNLASAVKNFLKVLTQDPDDFSIAQRLLVLLAERREFPGIVRFSRRIRLWRSHIDLLPTLIKAARATKHFDYARKLSCRLLALSPNHVAGWVEFAHLLKKSDKNKAKTALEIAGTRGRLDAEAIFLKGQLAKATGSEAQAIECWESILNDRDWGGGAGVHLVNVLMEIGAKERALSAAKKAIEVSADHPQMQDRYTELLIQLGQVDAAKEHIANLLGRGDLGPEMWNILCIHLKGLGHRIDAIAQWRQAISQYPNIAALLYNCGHALNEESLAEEALPLLRRAISLEPLYSKAWNALCVGHSIRFEMDEAIHAAERCLVIDPKLASAHVNIGLCWRGKAEFGKAADSFRRAFELDPQNAVAHQNLAHVLLMAGQIEEGFRQYEWRWAVSSFTSPRRPFKYPIFKGGKKKPGTVLIYMEQGMGDEVMFSWYLPYLKKNVENIVVECDRRLIPLFQRSFDGIEFVPSILSGYHPRTRSADVAFKAPIGHLPAIFWNETQAYIRTLWSAACKKKDRWPGHLVPDPVRQSFWRNYFRSRFPGKYVVGVSWCSAKKNRMREIQYLDPEEIAATGMPGVVFVNLQYSWLEADVRRIEAAAERRGYEFHTPEDIDLKDDLDDLHALMSMLDLIITPLTSVAWMGGAVGTPTWVFRSSLQRTIWQQLGVDFPPWCPSIRLFFRDPREDWGNCIDQISANLKRNLERRERTC